MLVENPFLKKVADAGKKKSFFREKLSFDKILVNPMSCFKVSEISVEINVWEKK